jgi:hypothetical protein
MAATKPAAGGRLSNVLAISDMSWGREKNACGLNKAANTRRF